MANPGIVKISANLMMWITLVTPFLLAASDASRDRGRRLFIGKESLKGTLAGHKSEMPALAVICSNCHRSDRRAGPSVGPVLDRAALTESQKRRGAPPSSYDAEAFCRILRTGVDPVYVVITQEMPRYDIDGAQCLSLWLYLTVQPRGKER